MLYVVVVLVCCYATAIVGKGFSILLLLTMCDRPSDTDDDGYTKLISVCHRPIVQFNYTPTFQPSSGSNTSNCIKSSESIGWYIFVLSPDSADRNAKMKLHPEMPSIDRNNTINCT